MYINIMEIKYNCIVSNYKRLYKVFTDECTKYGILYDRKTSLRRIKKRN